MRKVNRSALVPYSAREMFTLVDDVRSYPEFVPWCNEVIVEHEAGDVITATLELHKGPISKHFTTRNTRRPLEAIDMELVGGPFRYLSGGWRFTEIKDQGCRVSLELDFEFESKLVDMMFGTFFKDAGDALVDAFTARAREIYGPR